MAGGVEVAETLPRKLPQSWRLPRGLYGHDRQETRGTAQAKMAAHRRLLVSTWRHADRRVLASRPFAGGRLGPGSRGRAPSRGRVGSLFSAPSRGRRSPGGLGPKWVVVAESAPPPRG